MHRSFSAPFPLTCHQCFRKKGLLFCSKKHEKGALEPLIDEEAGQGSNAEAAPSEAAGLSWFQASGVLTNIILGLGVVNFPHAVKDAGGVASALGLIAICSLMILLSFWILSECADAISNCCTYQHMVEGYLGTWGKRVCNVILFVHNFGTCVTLVVVLGDQIETVIGMIGTAYWVHYLRLFLTPVICFAFILPMCFANKMENFKNISWMGVLTLLYLAVLVVVTYYTEPESTGVFRTESLYSTGNTGVLYRVQNICTLIPVIVFSFEGHIEAVPLYAELKHRSSKQFLKTAISTVVICATIFSIVGVYGYLLKGSDTPGDILLAFDQRDGPAICARIFVSVKCITTFPPVFFCIRLVLDENIRQVVTKIPNMCHKSEFFVHTLTVLSLFSVIVFLATVVPSLTSLVSLLGGSAAVFTFIFPGLCYCQAWLPALPWKLHLVLLGITATGFGVFVGTFSLLYSSLLYQKSTHT